MMTTLSDKLFSEHVEVNKYNCTEEDDVDSRLQVQLEGSEWTELDEEDFTVTIALPTATTTKSI